MGSNFAAWIPAPKERLQVKRAPFPTPKSDEIVVKNRSVAINPVDWFLQDTGTSMMFGWIKYPFIFGNDVAGEVVEVGSKVQRFKRGDRVMGQALGYDKRVNSAAQGAFQLYTVLLERSSTPIPDIMSFESASVLPLGLSTAAAALFEKDQLGLQLPQLEAEPTGKTVLIWGGSTSVGVNAIQLAVAAGYEVFSTCSPKNFDLLKSLGASQVFDYKDPAATDKIVNAMKGKTSAGAVAIGQNSAFFCLDVLENCTGDKNLAMATAPFPPDLKRFVLLQIMFYLVTSMVPIMIRAKVGGMKISFIYGIIAYSPVGTAVYVDFLPQALAKGKFRALPEPLVAGVGLEAIQGALEQQKKGVSAKKVVVSLE